MDIIIRKVKTEDAESIAEIYKYYVENTAVSFEEEAPSVDEIKRRIIATTSKYPYLVSEFDGEIIGYAYASPFKPRSAYRFSVETSIYVKKDIRGKGTGRLLYEHLEKALSEQGIKNSNACIAYTSVEDEYLTNDSMRFHEALGYDLVGTFHKCAYKFGRWYDMIWMEKMLGEHK